MITFNQDNESSNARPASLASSHPRYEVFEDEVLAIEPWGKTVVGFDLDTGQNVAVSIVDSSSFNTDDAADRFWRQVARRASIENPGLLPVREVDEDRQWIVTDAASMGWSPDLRHQNNESSSRVRAGLRSLLGGLGALHKASLVSGSWRPEELCTDEQGRARLRCLAPSVPAGRLGGTPSEQDFFLAPERATASESDRSDARADLYGLGVAVLFGLLRGDLSKALKPGILRKRRTPGASGTKWVAAKKCVPVAPADIAKVVDQLIETKPSERYVAASSALADLADEVDTNHTPPTDASMSRQRVVMQRSPLAADLANEHFKPINPVVADNETRIEKLFSPEHIYDVIKHPAAAGGLLVAVVAFLGLTRSTSTPVPRHTLAIHVQDGAEKPITGASLTVKNTEGVNQTFSLGQDSTYDIRLPRGSYELTLTRPGYRKCRKSVEVLEDSISPEVIVMQGEVVVPQPSSVSISPRTVDGHESDADTRFEFFLLEDASNSTRGSGEKLLAVSHYEHTIEQMMPGDEMTIAVRAEGYLEERLRLRYDEFPITLTPVLQRAPRWLVIKVDQQDTRLWADTLEIVGGSKRSSVLGDTYRLQVPYSKPSVSVDVLCEGFQKGRVVIPTPKEAGDLVHSIELDPLPPPPTYPLRKIETTTAGTKIYVDGKLLGTTRMEAGLPAGLHQVVLKRPDGEQRQYEVRFSDLLSQVAFDF